MASEQHNRSYTSIIQQAKLMAMAPPEVVEFLTDRKFSERPSLYESDDEVGIEAAILGRNEPAISLALAQYGRSRTTLRALFSSSELGGSIRLGVLSNLNVSGNFMESFPAFLFADPACTAAWLHEAPLIELQALFENRFVDDDFLTQVLERKSPLVVDDARFASILFALRSNPRMRTPYDQSYLDGCAEYLYGKVVEAAWKLADTLPTTPFWAQVLADLYNEMLVATLDMPVDEATARWHPAPSDEKSNLRETEDPAVGYLSNYQRVRKHLAHRVLSFDRKKHLASFLESDDVAIRAAAYAHGSLSSSQLKLAEAKDGELAFNETVENKLLWTDEAGREALREMAWTVSRRDGNSDLLAVNIFKSNERRFDAEQSKSSSDSHALAAKEDVVEVVRAMEQQTVTDIKSLITRISALEKRVNWIFWISLAVLAGSIFTRR